MPEGIYPDMKFKLLASLLVFTSFNIFQVSAFALDCTKAPDSQSPSCLSKQKSGNEEINQFSALAQKEAQRSANKSAAAKMPKQGVSAKTPAATVIPVPNPSENSNSQPLQNTENPQTKPSQNSSNSKKKIKKIAIKANVKNKSKKLVVVTCKNGKKIKKISGVNPACPPGFSRN